MEQPEDVDAWADAVLDAHRSGPRRTEPGGGLDSIDAWRVERLQRVRVRHTRLTAWQNGFEIVLAVGMLIVAAAWVAFF